MMYIPLLGTLLSFGMEKILEIYTSSGPASR